MILEVVFIDLRAEGGSHLLYGTHLIDLVHDTLLPEIVQVSNNEGSESANIPLKLSVLLAIVIICAATDFMCGLLWLASTLRSNALMLLLQRDEEQVENFLGREGAAEAILDLAGKEKSFLKANLEAWAHSVSYTYEKLGIYSIYSLGLCDHSHSRISLSKSHLEVQLPSKRIMGGQ